MGDKQIFTALKTKLDELKVQKDLSRKNLGTSNLHYKISSIS